MPTPQAQDYPDVFPAWRDVLEFGIPASFIYMIAAALVAILLYQRIQRSRARRARHRTIRQAVERSQADQHLNPTEATHLTEALEASGVNAPEAALASEAYFDRFVARALESRAGSGMAAALREKLFAPPPAVAPDALATETQSLAVGQELRLQFSTYPGAYRAVVIAVETAGIQVAFSDQRGRDLDLKAYDRANGIFEMGGELISFRTEVLEASPGTVYTCRLAHSTDVRHLTKRDSVRVRVSRPLHFEWVPAEAIRSTSRRGPTTAGKHRPSEGILLDLSLGGCAIAVSRSAQVDEDDIVIFRLDLSERVEAIDCVGRVLSLEAQPRANRAVLHIAFLGENPGRRERLGLALAELQHETDGPADDA